MVCIICSNLYEQSEIKEFDEQNLSSWAARDVQLTASSFQLAGAGRGLWVGLLAPAG